MAWKQQTDWTLGILRTSYVSCGLFMTFSNFTHRVSDGYFLILSIENIMSFLPARLICWLFHGSIRTTRDTEKSLELKQIKTAGFFSNLNHQYSRNYYQSGKKINSKRKPQNYLNLIY